MKKLFLVFLLAATVAQAETYRWSDQEGTVHFSESLGEIPAEQLKSAKPLGMDANRTTDRSMAVSSVETPQSADGYGSVAPGVEGLKGRMLNDEGIMALIGALQNDPEMQAILGDPAMIRAIQAGDIGTLLNNPGFLKLLDNPRIREIENRVQQGGTR